ncbi:RNA polymerase II-binding domain-containing protein [Exophiala viscosa]|uniref:RNA polymerase II-binding domain-containing protein n=1 Tax=Exophiala viscosa TaxID=2486360 RepID=A0AAN6DKU9_9EURO|nr:RNA polymerase II-binding domain-containing protein [Exophiala viscosa]KAI1628501.1 RNA polymerase II-binding domain-containing protein [Exophiala viscosa]
MSFSDEALKAKLSTLNETQDSIVSVSQWIMFHKRHADRIANYWLTRLRDSPPAKRLNFIYLVNDIVQNARARKRSEFPDAFAPLLPEAIQTAYRSSPPEIQSKIRRVVEVWRTRNVFEAPILQAIEARVDEIDKSKGSGGKKTLMGNSLFNSTSSTGMPKELETLAPLQIAVTKETISARPAIDTAQTEYTKLNDPSAVLPSPPVHAARLSSLIKSLAAAESAVSASIKARKALVADLQRILDINVSSLAKDEETYMQLDSRKTSTEAKKREVEDAIIRGLSSAEQAPPDNTLGAGSVGEVLSPGLDNGTGADNSGFFSSERPEVEALTPEPDEDDFGAFYQPQTPPQTEPVQLASNPAIAAALAEYSSTGNNDYNPLGNDFGGIGNDYGSAGLSRARSSSGPGLNGSSAKRQKMSHGDEEAVPDLGEMGMESFGDTEAAGGEYNPLQDLDDDVSELLRQEGGGA